MPRPEVLEDYYARYYADADREVTFSQPLRFARHLFAALPRQSFGSTIRILDYGGGDGSLSKAIAGCLMAQRKTRSAEIVVVDYSAHSLDAGENIVVRHALPGEAIEGQFDLVLASAILEHIPELNAVLKSLHGALVVGGFFYARTPYVIPLTKIYPRLDLTYPAHVHDMGSSFWNRFPETFSWPVRVISSRPSVVANNIREDPLRTLAALVLKMPAHIENRLSPRWRKNRFWRFVGGWEVLLRRV